MEHRPNFVLKGHDADGTDCVASRFVRQKRSRRKLVVIVEFN